MQQVVEPVAGVALGLREVATHAVFDLILDEHLPDGLGTQFDGTIDRRHGESRLRVTGRDDMLGERTAADSLFV